MFTAYPIHNHVLRESCFDIQYGLQSGDTTADRGGVAPPSGYRNRQSWWCTTLGVPEQTELPEHPELVSHHPSVPEQTKLPEHPELVSHHPSEPEKAEVLGHRHGSSSASRASITPP